MSREELDQDLFEVMLKHATHDYCKEYLASMPSEEEFLKEFPIDPEFDAKMLRLCAKEEHRRLFRRAPAVLKQIAAAVLIFLGISFSLFLFSPIVQAALKTTVMHWFSQFTSYEFTGNSAEITDLAWEPAYLPEGFALSAVQFSGDAVYREYRSGDEGFIQFDTFKASTETEVRIDNEHTTFSQIELNGVPADLYTATTDEESSHLLWVRDGYTIHIMSNLHIDEIIKMAELTKIKN